MNARSVLLILIAGGLLLLLTACRTGPFARPVAEEMSFPVEAEVVFSETLALLETSGYRIHGANPASGRIEAFSALRADPGFRQTMQRRIRISIVDEGSGRSRLFLTATILEESEMPVHGQGTFERPVSDGWFYEKFFEELAGRLGIDRAN